MTRQRSDEALINFYARQDESSRLSRGVGCVEFLRTQTLLRQRFRSPQRILDVGGAAGVHASWLSDDGHDVEIVDVVPDHVESARQRGLQAQVGDARSLAYSDASFDAVIMLGPLYHLPAADERARALGEARRVLRPDGVIAAAGVSRLSVPLSGLRQGRLADTGFQRAAQRIASTGRDDTGYGAGLFYFHTEAQLRDELSSAGFGEIDVRGVEGPAWPFVDVATTADDPLAAHVVEIAAMADQEPAAIAASIHLLVFGTRQA